jgi:hypothetical protein
MQSYLAGADVKLDITLAGYATSASYRVTDEDGTVQFDGPVPGFQVGAPSMTFVVPGALNQPNRNMVRGYRLVEVRTVTADGVVPLVPIEYTFEVAAAALLTPGVNSFQNIAKAELIALDLPNLPGWAGADRPTRITAMVQARLNLDKLRYRYREMADDWMAYILPQFGISSLIQLTQAQYIALPADFRFALERAQIIEADDLIGGNPITDKRIQGITSEKIGESSTQFSGVAPVRGLVCNRALNELSRFVQTRMRLSRA